MGRWASLTDSERDQLRGCLPLTGLPQLQDELVGQLFCRDPCVSRFGQPLDRVYASLQAGQLSSEALAAEARWCTPACIIIEGGARISPWVVG